MRAHRIWSLGSALAALLAARSGAGLEHGSVEPTATSAVRDNAPAGPLREPDHLRDRPGYSLLVVMNVVVERLLPKLIDDPASQASRASFKNGLFGLGPYEPPGETFAGPQGPPLQLFPRAGFGTSLNRDPITGRSHVGFP